MNMDEVETKLRKAHQVMDELVYALMQKGMSYRQAEEEAFRKLHEKRPKADRHPSNF